jgi:putative ABC transport system permease protein
VYPFIKDVSFSLRSLRRSPGFTLIAVLTLTLGVLVATVLFTVINATILRTLPYPKPDRLMVLRWQDRGDVSADAFFMVKNQTHVFSSLAALYPVDVGANISGNGQPQYVKALSVSKEFFPALGVLPEIGRSFSNEEDQPNAPGTVIISFGLWTERFDRDPSALGQGLAVNSENFKIIGIMPREFQSSPEADIWLPLRLSAGAADPGNNYRVIGRLAPAISRQQAQFELNQLSHQYQSIHVSSAGKGTLVLRDLQSFMADRAREGLAILSAAVAFLFLIACTNVAVLVLVRAAANTQTIALRVALGSSRRRLLFSLSTESLLLSSASGVFGLILAKESLPLILLLWPADLPLNGKLSIDGRIALFTLAVAIISLLFSGFVPALTLSRVNLAQVLARASRIASASAEQIGIVRLLILGQMALTAVLLAGTILLVKSLLNLYSVPLGFAPEHLEVAQVSLTGKRYNTTASTNRLLNKIVRQLEVTPGVDAVAAVEGLPLENGLNLPLHPVEMPQAVDHADEYRPVTPDYFQTFRIPLRSGRLFLATDAGGSAPVAIVNETLARRWWPDGSAIGHYLRVDEELGPQPADVPRQIVGVVADIHEKGPDIPPPPSMFVPLSQTPDNITAFFNKVFMTSIIIRSGRRIDSDQIRNVIQSVDPDLPLASSHPLIDRVSRSLANRRFITLLTSVFSAFALLLTVVGIHGLLSYQARLRTREIAVRMAVGASRIHIIRMVAQQGVNLLLFALLVGLAGSFLIKRLLTHLLYDVGNNSTVGIVGTGLLLGLIATLLSLITAVRSASIEPMAVLRNE